MLQLLDDGRLTDGQGRTVSFQNTVVIMTSNLGSPEILAQQERGADFAKIKAGVLNILQQHFRPELLNRVDETVVFHALNREQVRQISGILMSGLAKRTFTGAGIRLEWDEAALDYLAKKGYEPVYGARPLKRLLQQEVETMLSRMIIQGETSPQETVIISARDGKLTFQKK